MSVALGIELDARHVDPFTLLQGWEGHGLVSLSIAVLRDCALGVVRDPLPDEPWHALVWGRKTGSVRKKLVRAAEWIERPLRR